MKPVQRPLHAIFLVPLVLGIVTFSLCTARFLPFSLFLLALVIACALYAWLSCFGIRLEVQAPSRVTEGDSAAVSLLLTVRSRLPRFVAASVVDRTVSLAAGLAWLRHQDCSSW